MDDRDRDPFVDDLLDAMLARHRNAEPRPGLDERVLARLRAEQQPKPWSGWTWRLAAGVAGLAIVLATAHWARRTVFAPGTPARSSGSSEMSKSSTSVSASRPEVAKPVASHPARRTTSRTVRQAAPIRSGRGVEPRREVFPSPTPLSEQERLLIAYLKLNSSRDFPALHSADEEIEEIQIKPLEIVPLKSESSQPDNEIN